MNTNSSSMVSLSSGTLPSAPLLSALPTATLTDKRVLLRVDLNVPISNGKISNDYRLKAILPTIDMIQKKGAKVILATHIGRPKKPDSSLSTRHLISWFENHGYTIEFEPHLEKAQKKSFENKKTILLLENLRFFPGEKKENYSSDSFAQQLADCADYYVNDAFAVLHRENTSITKVPLLFSKENRTIGLLVETELTELNKLITAPKKPFVLIIGGGKITTKLPLLLHLLDKVDTILLCPATVFTPLKALGKPVGKSLVDNNSLSTSKELFEKAKKQNVTIMLPIDYQVADKTTDGPLSIVDAENFPENAVGISIGPKTAELFGAIINQAQTIFFNGAIGFAKRPETLLGMKSILTAMKNSDGFTVVGGGDTVGVVQKLGLSNDFGFLSTGGGATLAYLSGKELPGLSAFKLTT